MRLSHKFVALGFGTAEQSVCGPASCLLRDLGDLHQATLAGLPDQRTTVEAESQLAVNPRLQGYLSKVTADRQYPFPMVAPFESRIHLSPPRATQQDARMLVDALESGWLAPSGPDLQAFEEEMASYLGVSTAVALSSGTAAIHMAMKAVGVKPGDCVIIPTLTFGATAFPAVYLGAEPIFVDVDTSWNMDPEMLAEALLAIAQQRKSVSAVVPVDLYGVPADYSRLVTVAGNAGVPLVEDAAEGLGAFTERAKLGTFGVAATLSFNGNKIITTSGGGMFVSDNQAMGEKVRFWSSQSRLPRPWYEHHEIGYNYRMSNLLAALGRSQLRRIDDEVFHRRVVRNWYSARLESREGISVRSDPPWGTSNAWLTVVTFDQFQFPRGAPRVRKHLERHNVESRPVWKPMHLQPVFAASQSFLSGAAERAYREGLCLPSGSGLKEEDVDRICGIILEALHK